MARKSIDWMKTMPELLNEWDYEKNNIIWHLGFNASMYYFLRKMVRC